MESKGAAGGLLGIGQPARRKINISEIPMHYSGSGTEGGSLLKLFTRFLVSPQPDILHAEVAAGFKVIRKEAQSFVQFSNGFDRAFFFGFAHCVGEGVDGFAGYAPLQLLRGDEAV